MSDDGTARVPIPAEILALASSTLDDVDRPAWPPAPDDAPSTVRRVHALRRVPLGELTVEDLRLLVGQHVALGTTVPLALGMLRYRPLLEGDHYPGDLLMAVLHVPDEYWAQRPQELAVLREALSRLDPDDPDYPVLEDDELTRAASRFRA